MQKLGFGSSYLASLEALNTEQFRMSLQMAHRESAQLQKEMIDMSLP